MKIVSYARNSGGPGQTENTIDQQHERIAEVARARGWLVVARESEMISSRKRRPALERCIDGCKRGKYDAVVVAKLDRVSRSVYEFLGFMGQAANEGWSLICLDPEVDMTSPYGKAMATIAATFAELERDLISQRTKEGIAQRRANGQPWGRPREVPQKLVDEIHVHRKSGMTSQEIADLLTLTGEPTASGGPWSDSLVRYIWTTYDASAAT